MTRKKYLGVHAHGGAQMKRFATLIALAAFAVSVQAAPETYVIDNSYTSSQFSYRTLGLSNQTHRFEKISGKMVFDHATRTGSAHRSHGATPAKPGQGAVNPQ